MKITSFLLAVALLGTSYTSQAGVVVGGTRLIFDGSKKESSLSVTNPDKNPYLIQTWVETVSGGAKKVPFLVTPPLFRLDGGQNNVLRVVNTGGNIPSDKESLYWLNIKSIPSANKDNESNTLLIAVKSRIKLIFRPQGLNGVPDDVANKLRWQRKGSTLRVTNPTPFYMNFQQVKIAGKNIKDVTYVAPGSSADFMLPQGVSAGNVSWKIINDYGGVGKEHSAPLS